MAKTCGILVLSAKVVYWRVNRLSAMLRFPIPSAPKEKVPSICSDWGHNKLFWISNDDAETLDDAWDCYVSDQFGSSEQADYLESMAREEFENRLGKAVAGRLKPILEVKDMVHAPGVYEIRWPEWKDECAHRISARLFHKERRKERWIVSARLMCKKGTRDETELYYKQTGFAVQAGQIADRCRDDGWTGLTECIPDGLN